MSTTTQRLGLFKYDTVADSAVPFNIDDALNYNWDILEQKVGANRNIGEIIASSLPLIDAGLHLLDGALILGDGIYSEFVEYIANLYTENPNANYFTDETTWQESISQYGVCGKFVYDSLANTVRLPKITGILEGTTDLTALGDLVEAGLPNITGTSQEMIFRNGNYNSRSGCLNYQLIGGFWDSNSGSSYQGDRFQLNIDASRSSSIYGNSLTVQPQTIKVLYYIVVATSVKTDVEIDIDQVATDLNGKADVDLTNCTKPHIVETYINGTSWYRVYSDGWCEQGGYATASKAGEAGLAINFLKNFVDTNYIIIGNQCTGSTMTTGSGSHGVSFGTLSESSAYAKTSDSNWQLRISWQASGYIS